MTAISLENVLAATGYMPDGQSAVGLHIRQGTQRLRPRGRDFAPDALWRSRSALTVYFKFESTPPSDETVGKWRREVWNEGFAPLLWVVSPQRIDLYNGFGTPVQHGDAQKHLIQTFENIDASLNELDALAGRLALETGQFWVRVPVVDRKTSVDQELLSALASLERDLVGGNLNRDAAQALIGRVIFTQYLIDREIVSAVRLKRLCGHGRLPPILRDREATAGLFSWLSETFNGDMFPPSSVRNTPATSHLLRVADFLEAVDPKSGQRTLFPYQFDVIPVELISSIYEQFAHSEPRLEGKRTTEAIKNGVHYTRLSVVSLVLDEVMNGLTGNESVLDLTCGSGVFLVEALRRLASLKARGHPLTRDLIRSTLYEQIYGVDISEAAVRIAAFSLYLAALELDPDPQPPHALRFRPLIGKTLLIGDARTVEESDAGKTVLKGKRGLRQFDLIVGNPPWSFNGQAGTEARRKTRIAGIPVQPRGEGFDFVLRAAEFSHEKTRFGVVLHALPFFSRSSTGMAAVQYVMKTLAPVTLVNLANLRDWLFATAKMPAIAFFARHRPQRADQVTVVQIPWTPSSTRTQSFEVSPRDIITLSMPVIEVRPITLKAAAVGSRRDVALVDSLVSTLPTLGTQFAVLGVELNVGLIRGLSANQTRDARQLKDLELLEADDIKPFQIPDRLPPFKLSRAQWPRSRDIYRAPILIVKETLNVVPRVIAAVADRDLVFTNAMYGAALPEAHRSSAHLVAAILSSSFATWFFLMSSAEFGIKKMRLTRHDIALLPMPDLAQTVKSQAGKRLLRIERKLQSCQAADSDLDELDDVTCEIYGLDEADRIVVRDGLYRATWQWQKGREDSAASADARTDVIRYARVFLGVMGGWLAARNKRHMRAEVFDLPGASSLRVVRFVLEDGLGETRVELVTPDGSLNDVLDRIGRQLKVKLAAALSGQRELRIHGRNEVVVIKPAAQRFWMSICALEDADAVVTESFTGGSA